MGIVVWRRRESSAGEGSVVWRRREFFFRLEKAGVGCCAVGSVSSYQSRMLQLVP